MTPLEDPGTRARSRSIFQMLVSIAFVAVGVSLRNHQHWGRVFVVYVGIPFSSYVAIAGLHRILSREPQVRVDDAGIYLYPAFVAWRDVKAVRVYSFTAWSSHARFLGVEPTSLGKIRVAPSAVLFWPFLALNHVLGKPAMNVEERTVSLSLEEIAEVIRRDHDIKVEVEPI